MTQVQPICPTCRDCKGSVYNAVKIQVNSPQTILPEGLKLDGCSEYNAVNIEVNVPKAYDNKDKTYSYPESKSVVTYDRLDLNNRKHIIPVAYQTNFVNNRTFIAAEINEAGKEVKTAEKEADEQIVEVEEQVIAPDKETEDKAEEVPAPSFTTVEEEKIQPAKLSFHGIAFKAEKKEPNILQAAIIRPVVNIENVVSKLSSEDYDIQAEQMAEIAKAAVETPKEAVAYITPNLFSALIKLIEKDSSDLEGPSEQQLEIRKKIIINEMTRAQALANGKKPEEIVVPFEVSEEDNALAQKLSPLEMAERNKEYAMFTTAALDKVYSDEVKKQTMSVIPLTELPGVASSVDVLKKSTNPGVKVAALTALLYIQRPEYNDELKSLFEIASKDKNPYVAKNAELASQQLEK